MFITCPAFSDHTHVPTSHTCDGENISPPFEFGDFPSKTKSLVLVVEDRDAVPDPWVHWLVFNIPPAKGLSRLVIFLRGAQRVLPTVGHTVMRVHALSISRALTITPSSYMRLILCLTWMQGPIENR